MRWEYHCPKCDALLNPGMEVILRAQHQGTRIMIGFHPKPGNFEVYLAPDVEVEIGDKWEFSCPTCRKNLVAARDENLCELEMWHDGDFRQVFFSRVAAEHATFIVQRGTLIKMFGIDAVRYLALWPQLITMRKYFSLVADGPDRYRRTLPLAGSSPEIEQRANR